MSQITQTEVRYEINSDFTIRRYYTNGNDGYFTRHEALYHADLRRIEYINKVFQCGIKKDKQQRYKRQRQKARKRIQKFMQEHADLMI